MKAAQLIYKLLFYNAGAYGVPFLPVEGGVVAGELEHLPDAKSEMHYGPHPKQMNRVDNG